MKILNQKNYDLILNSKKVTCIIKKAIKRARRGLNPRQQG